jgi:hypothetical protein
MWGAVHFWLSSLYFWGSSGIRTENRRSGFTGAKGNASNISADLSRKGFTGAVPSISDMSMERCLKGMTGAVADIASIKIERRRIGWRTGEGQQVVADTTMDRCRQGFLTGGGVPRAMDTRRRSLTGAVSISLGSLKADMVGEISL